MKRIGDKAARVLLTIFGVKTTIIIGTILTFAVILIAIITGLMGTISTSGGKGGKTNAQCVTYQKDGDEEDDVSDLRRLCSRFCFERYRFQNAGLVFFKIIGIVIGVSIHSSFFLGS